MRHPWLKLTLILLSSLIFTAHVGAAQRPNIHSSLSSPMTSVSGELPLYGSSVWSPPLGGDTSDPAYRALAGQVWILCSGSPGAVVTKRQS